MNALLGSFALAAILSWVLGALEMIPCRRSRTAHWTERARALHPFRIFAASISWVLPGALALIGVAAGRTAEWALIMLGGYLGTIAGQYPLERQLYPGLRMRPWLRLAGANVVMTLTRFGVLAAAIALMPAALSWISIAVVLMFLVAHFALQCGGALRLLRWLRILEPASPRLAALVEEASAQAAVKPRAVWELSSPQANAFAAVVTGELLFTSKLLEVAPDEDIKAICAHELAHLTEGRGAIGVRLAASLALLPLVFLVPITSQWGPASALVLAGAAFTIGVGGIRFAHWMEKKADRSAIATTRDGPAYARALERIHETNEWPVVLPGKKLKTHPDLYDRMLAAGVPPAFPKPSPPREVSWSIVVLSTFCGMAFVALFVA